MPRPLRINYNNAWYHVMNRGAGHKTIFRSIYDRKFFLEILEDSCNMYNAVIAAYCLMDNHYHLLLCTPNANLSRVMRHINGTYTQKFNRAHKTDGPLFKGRFTAKLIEDDNYRLIVSRYIHLNPVEASLVLNPADYEWSSYREYINLRSTPAWLAKEIILADLTCVNDYKEYVEATNIGDSNLYNSSNITDLIVGTEKFKQLILDKIQHKIPLECMPEFKRARKMPTIEIIIEHVCLYYNIKQVELISCKKSSFNWPHLISIYICRKMFGHELHHIASHFGFARTEAISAKVRKCHLYLQYDARLSEEMNEITERIKNSV